MKGRKRERKTNKASVNPNKTIQLNCIVGSAMQFNRLVFTENYGFYNIFINTNS